MPLGSLSVQQVSSVSCQGHIAERSWALWEKPGSTETIETKGWGSLLLEDALELLLSLLNCPGSPHILLANLLLAGKPLQTFSGQPQRCSGKPALLTLSPTGHWKGLEIPITDLVKVVMAGWHENILEESSISLDDSYKAGKPLVGGIRNRKKDHEQKWDEGQVWRSPRETPIFLFGGGSGMVMSR